MYDQVTAIGAWTTSRIMARVNALTAVLANDLDPNSRQPVTFTGDVSMQNPATDDFYRRLTAITGTLTVSHAAVSPFDLPRLQTIGGDLLVDGQSLSHLSLPSLRSVGGNVIIQNNGSLSAVSLPSLESIGGNLIIDNNGTLNTLELGQLATLSGTLTITDNGDLPTAQANGLLLQLGSPAGATIAGNAP